MMKEVKKKEANINLGDLVYNDPSTMERLVKIVEALWNGTANLVENPFDGRKLACQIGGHRFYFMGSENENVKLDDIKNHFGVFEIANLILDAMTELSDDEYAYYCDVLNF